MSSSKPHMYLAPALFAIVLIVSCGDDSDRAIDTDRSDEQDSTSIAEILFSPKMPSLYDPAEDFLRHFRACGHPEWISNGKYRNTAVVNINEASPHLFDRQKTYAITIRACLDDQLSKLSFIQAREFAVTMLPATPPLRAEEASKYPHDALTFSLVTEHAYLVSDNEQPVVTYSAKYVSAEKQPTFGNVEGGAPYYEAIAVTFTKGGLKEITVGGVLYFPARLQKSEEIEVAVLLDEERLRKAFSQWQQEK